MKLLKLLLNKLSGNRPELMMRALEGSLSWSNLPERLENLPESKVKHSTTKNVQHGMLKVQLKVRKY